MYKSHSAVTLITPRFTINNISASHPNNTALQLDRWFTHSGIAMEQQNPKDGAFQASWKSTGPLSSPVGSTYATAGINTNGTPTLSLAHGTGLYKVKGRTTLGTPGMTEIGVEQKISTLGGTIYVETGARITNGGSIGWFFGFGGR